MIASLHNDLRFAPENTKQRQMDDAEKLMRDIRTERLYPLEYVVFRITRFRPSGSTLDATVVGDALIRDLGAFVQALSSDISMEADQSRGMAVGVDQIAETLGVNRRTVQRYRGDGLILHWVKRGDGPVFLGCFPDALEHYLERSPQGMRRMRAWTRVSSLEQAAILDRARSLATSKEVSLHTASVMIAEERKRAVSTIRHVLIRGEKTARTPIFRNHGPLTDRDAALCERSYGIGIPISKLSDRFHKSVPAVHRAMLRYRQRRLSRLSLDSVWQKTFDREDASQVLLEFSAVQENLPGPDTIMDLASDHMAVELEHVDRVVVAIQLLIGRARRQLMEMEGQPTSRVIDSIECDVRWAGRLRGRLLEQAVPAILKGCQQWLGRPISDLSKRAAFQLVNSCIEAVWPVIETLEPRMADRLEARCLNAVDRLLAVRQPPRELLASARHEPGGLVLPWPLRSLVDWDWLEPRQEWTSRVDSLNEEDKTLISMRWGLGGDFPRCIESIGRVHGLSWTVVQKRLHAIEVHLRTNSRESNLDR